MFLNDFPKDIESYFKILKNSFGEGYTPLSIEDPWYFEKLKKIFTSLHPDEAIKRYRESKWSHLRTLYSLQLARSDKAVMDDLQTSHFLSVCGEDPDSRSYGQLPCTIKSIQSRVSIISSKVAKDSSILILGDDDALSVALAREGFTDITVFEIDEKIVKKLQSTLRDFPNTKHKVIQQDIFKETHSEFIRHYDLVAFDPWYAVDGVEAFIKCALKTCENVNPIIVLSFNCGALLEKFSELESYLRKVDYGIRTWSPLLNTYPMPNRLKFSIGLAEFTASLFSFKLIKPSTNRERIFFSSDLMILEHIGN